MNNLAISKYLADYAEPGNTFTLDAHYQFSLVIPAYKESADQVMNTWQNIPGAPSFLVLLVINSKAARDSEAVRLAEAITRDREHFSPANGLTLARGSAASPDILILDRYSTGKTIDSQKGVGLARKLGTDIALCLHHQGIIYSRTLLWI